MRKLFLLLIICLPLISISQKIIIGGNSKDEIAQPPQSVVADCSLCVTSYFDKVTGDSLFHGKEISLLDNDKESLLVMTTIVDNRLVLSFFLNGKCVDAGSKINILFDDNSRLELINEHSYNCNGEATVYFGNALGKQGDSKEAKELRSSIPDFFAKQEKLPQLKELRAKKIQTIRIWAFDSFVQADFPEKESSILMNSVNCLANRINTEP